PPPSLDALFFQTGVLGYAYGHLWERPGLSRRERRIVTIAAVATADSPTLLNAHVRAALASGDLTKEEMDEIVLQFCAYFGFVNGALLGEAVEAAWESVTG